MHSTYQDSLLPPQRILLRVYLLFLVGIGSCFGVDSWPVFTLSMSPEEVDWDNMGPPPTLVVLLALRKVPSLGFVCRQRPEAFCRTARKLDQSRKSLANSQPVLQSTDQEVHLPSYGWSP